MSFTPALYRTVILTSSFALLVAACGDPDDNGDNGEPGQGIVGAWVGNGDVLVSGFEVDDDHPRQGSIPEEGLPSLGNPVDGCSFPRGLELYPTAQVDSELDPADASEEDPIRAESWVTSFDIDDQLFSLRFDANVRVPEDPEGVGGAHYRTGANAYVVDVYHPDPDADGEFELVLSWAGETDYEIPDIVMDPPLAFETGEVEINLVSHGELFVTHDGECAPVTFDDPIFPLEMDQDSEPVDGSTSITIDGERATLVLYALGEVDIDSRSTLSESDEWVTGQLDALFELEVVAP